MGFFIKFFYDNKWNLPFLNLKNMNLNKKIFLGKKKLSVDKFLNSFYTIKLMDITLQKIHFWSKWRLYYISKH